MCYILIYHLAIYCISLTIAYAHRTNIAQIAPLISHFLYLLVSFQLLAEKMYIKPQKIIMIVNTAQTIYVAASIISWAIVVTVLFLFFAVISLFSQ